MNLAELRAAVIQIGVTLTDTVDTEAATMAYAQAVASFCALMAGSNNPAVAPMVAYLHDLHQLALVMEGKPDEATLRLYDFAATIL
ncbi:hypothetical protein [Actinocrispum wychmicini]|uniref:Uncharacterized protein n=1 Tax=Actinocrispum wychmicini TaxID=1213861 RepID=A0A4R2JEY1_9PSEU|nr:hypothetical protein [Actinocrispum wychmicini]TCO57107.1 hypothetical protein EV192_106584 [Actinocrispum wychmicini]